MLQLYLVGPARIWLSDLEKNSIFCWFDLKTAFEKHFRGTYKRPATASDLQACIQKKGESSRNFLTRWLACRNECENVDHTTAMWSEVPCTFDREDHPAIVPKEYYALVVSPRIDGYDFSKCLMDGGASLNIMYVETLERMNLTKEQLKHSNTEFHGVVPGKKANSLGSITLPVAFGDVHNFREEKITFEVVPFKSSYHVIFGRPTYHKFHARACYIYNKLKIPGPNGMITITGDYKKAHECELGEAAFASLSYPEKS
ncbi:hypothetical protein QYE76_001754 [Lolium multiflorum]|uniref:Retrotransposon gag domain-containing protein n=1 Tax=Lolium multiflorum TaxID=4521 RepID=A0AAD8VYW7_LOLMU|nr:hypothetical protein QYE76_001754 [Lolium multiflorum]